MSNLNYRRVRTTQFQLYFDVCDRHARRKIDEMLEYLGKQKGDPIFFHEFCKCAKRPPEEVAEIFGWKMG